MGKLLKRMKLRLLTRVARVDIRRDERRGREKLSYGDTAGLNYGAAVHWEIERGVRAFLDLNNVR